MHACMHDDDDQALFAIRSIGTINNTDFSQNTTVICLLGLRVVDGFTSIASYPLF